MLSRELRWLLCAKLPNTDGRWPIPYGVTPRKAAFVSNQLSEERPGTRQQDLATMLKCSRPRDLTRKTRYNLCLTLSNR